MVLAIENDQIFDAPGDEQVAVSDEAEVAGAEKGPLVQARQRSAEGTRGLGRATPVSLGDMRARHPDLTDPIGRARRAGLRIHDQDRAIRPGGIPAASNERSQCRVTSVTRPCVTCL